MSLRKKLRDASREINKNKGVVYDEDDNAVITVKAFDKEQIFSSYDYDSNEKLNEELGSYIWDKARLVPANKEIKIKVYTSKGVNKKEVSEAIRNNYKKDYIEIQALLKKNLFFSLAMLVIGLVFMTFLFLSYAFFRNDYIDAIIDIVTWVFLWEAVDAFCLERSSLKKQSYTHLKLYTANIEIIGIDKEKVTKKKNSK